jgi:hypothetical protein
MNDKMQLKLRAVAGARIRYAEGGEPSGVTYENGGG